MVWEQCQFFSGDEHLLPSARPMLGSDSSPHFFHQTLQRPGYRSVTCLRQAPQCPSQDRVCPAEARGTRGTHLPALRRGYTVTLQTEQTEISVSPSSATDRLSGSLMGRFATWLSRWDDQLRPCISADFIVKKPLLQVFYMMQFLNDSNCVICICTH